MSGCEVSILLANVFKLTRSRIDDLNIASNIFFAPYLAEIVEAKRFGIRDAVPQKCCKTHCSYAISDT